MVSKDLKIKVAIIEPIGGHGGMHYYDKGLSLGLSQYVDSIYLFSSNMLIDFEKENLIILNSFDLVWKTKNKISLFIIYVYCLLKSLLIAYRNKCNIIHLHQFDFSFLFILNVVITKIFFKKIIVTVHDIESFEISKFKKFNIFEKFIYSLICKYIVHNKFSFEKLKEKIISTKINIIPHGNYIPFIKRVSRNVNNTVFNILFFGHLKKVKGLDILLAGLAELKKENSNFILTIAGRPWRNNFSFYNEIIIKNDLTSNLQYNLNYIQDDEVYNYFNNADLVILPYKRIYQSGVLLLSMSYGRAVLASDLSAFSEIIVDGVNGYLFHSEDVESLTNKLREITKNVNKLKEIEKNAYGFIKENYDWFKIGEETYNIYQEII